MITREIVEHLPVPLPKVGLLNLFVQHTSCALSINENADPDVRGDMDRILNHLVKENEPYYEHTLEGSDDMPAHAKCSLFGVSLTIFVNFVIMAERERSWQLSAVINSLFFLCGNIPHPCRWILHGWKVC